MRIWRRWWAFCNETGDDPFQAEEATVAYFIAMLLRPGTLSVRSVRRYMSAIVTICVEHGHSHPIEGRVRLERMLRGARRMYGDRARRTRLPITTGVLARIWHLFNDCLREDRVARAAAAVAVYALLRGAEVAPKARGAQSYLRQRDLRWCNSQHAVLCISSSKTDPFGRGVEIHLHGNGSVTCPNYGSSCDGGTDPSEFRRASVHDG